MKRTLASLSILVLFSCGSKTKAPEIAPAGQAKIIAAYIRQDSTTDVAWLLRIIEDNIKYDSVTKRKDILTDTSWGYPAPFTYAVLDSLKNPVRDSSGKVMVQQRIEYVKIGKDSVNYHVENIPLDSMQKWPHWKK